MPWSPSNPPKRGGSYSRFLVKRRQTVPPSLQGIVALPITHDWGPFKTFVRCTSMADFEAIFGPGANINDTPPVYTPGYIAAYNAFRGESDDRPGAGDILVYRTGAAAAAKATKILQNTTPAAAVTVTARYEGTRGNNLKVRVEANAVDSVNKNDLVITEAGLELERFTHAKTDMVALVADINKRSNWITAVQTITGVALAILADTALTGGNDGATLLAADWTALMTAFESQRFDIFAPYDLTDTSIQTSIDVWVKGLNAPTIPGRRSKRFHTFLGGALAETAAVALAAAVGFDDENLTRVGIGTYKDTRLGVNLSTSQLVPRIAGILARRGYDAGIHFAHLDDIEIVTGPSETDVMSAISDLPGQGGVLVLTLDSAGVRIEFDVTTRVSDTADRPKETFGRIKHVYTMQNFERQLQERHESGEILGLLDVNNDTREFLVGDARVLLDTFVRVGAIQPGATVGVSADPPPSDDQRFVALDWLGKFGRTLDQVRNTFYLS